MNRLASKTTFTALQVDSGEESEDEQSAVPETDPEPSSSQPSKSALKKAQKLARNEKRQLAKKEKSVTSSSSPSSDIQHQQEQKSVHLPDEDKIINENLCSLPIPASEDALLEEEETYDDLTDGHLQGALSYPTTGATTPDYPPEESKSSAESQAALNPEAEKAKKIQNAVTRTTWGFAMVAGFISLMLLGHAYVIILVMICQAIVYREVTALFSLKLVAAPEQVVKRDPWSKTLSWYFFAVANYFFYGESLIYYFKHVVFNAQLLPFATNHRIISFMLYMIGFVGFVVSLKKGFLRQQFGLFCWVHMSLLLFVVSCHFIVNNILEGLIWFWVPTSLVICNDVFAYAWGITIGRTPLIKLSPKKTVEGFVGAFGTTIIFGIFWGTYFMRSDYLICPAREFGVSAWTATSCQSNPVFVWKEWHLWAPLQAALGPWLGKMVWTSGWYAPYQIHLIVMSCFASLVAPFGGFFASGFKRAFDIKDFGHSIPGHGGMTDRMDCQFLMGVFTYVYYSSIIRQDLVTTGAILQLIVSGLSVTDQMALYKDLQSYLIGQGIVI